MMYDIARLADLAFDTPGIVVPAFSNGFYTVTPDELQRFAVLVAAAEREACALLVEKKCAENWVSVDKVAAAIRARGKAKRKPDIKQ